MSRQSKLLSRILRHEPELAGLSLGPGGWVSVAELVTGLKRMGQAISREDIVQIVETNDKRRFTLSEDGTRIRAAQGHSVAVDLQLPVTTPPATLYHGTASTNLDAIFTDGLVPGRRHDVHLSDNPDTALRVGQRHGKAVVLIVDAATMVRNGYPFRKADNGVWLTPVVPPAFLDFHTDGGRHIS